MNDARTALPAAPLGDASPRAALAEAGRVLARRGHVRATSGNLSVRTGRDRALITASGRDKGALGDDDFLEVDLDGRPLDGGVPSAETLLHAQIYTRYPDASAVVHVHAIAAAVMGRLAERDGAVVVSGWEMAKALRGITSHTSPVRIPVFGNDQDMTALAARIAPSLSAGLFGYVLAGHGLYAWGRDLAEAMRHADALDYLLDCELLLRRNG